MALPASLIRVYTLFILCLFALAPFQAHAENFATRLNSAALERINHDVVYDGAYFNIPYPNGDVPADKGVCTDVIIRAYRTLGIDLQKLVHEDMKENFSTYPAHWGLTKTDTNIDHRRVPNLRTFFKRHGEELSIARSGAAYQAGDLVTWNLNPNGNLPHIGIVTDKTSPETGFPMIVHNIGAGPVLEDILFKFAITGHYRYHPKTAGARDD